MLNIWTEELVERLTSMANDKLSGSQIAKQLGVSRNAVIGKVHRLGIKLRSEEWQATPEYMTARKIERAEKRRLKQERLDRKRIAMQALRGLAVQPSKSFPARPVPKPVSLDPLNLTMDQLHSFHCRYITNDDMANATYCGHPTFNDSSWCSFHHARVYTSREQAREDGQKFLVERRKWKHPAVLVDVLGEKTEALGVQT